MRWAGGVGRWSAKRDQGCPAGPMVRRADEAPSGGRLWCAPSGWPARAGGKLGCAVARHSYKGRHRHRPRRCRGLTIARFVEGLLGCQQGMAEPAGVPGQRHPGLDGTHAAGAEFLVALAEAGCVLGQAPGDAHERVAVLSQAWREMRPRLVRLADW